MLAHGRYGLHKISNLLTDRHLVVYFLLSASSPAAAETKKEKEPATAEKAAAVSEEQYEDMSDEAIEALSQEVGSVVGIDNTGH